MIDMDRYFSFFYIFLLLLLCACENDNNKNEVITKNVYIDIVQHKDFALSITYRLTSPQRYIDFGTQGDESDDIRLHNWVPSTPGFLFNVTENRLILSRSDKKPFSEVSVNAKQTPLVRHSYQPIYKFSDAGVVIYTGYFQPFVNKYQRQPAIFEFKPLAGNTMVAFGPQTDRLTEWQSPKNHPALIYLGPPLSQGGSLNDAGATILTDPNLPSWIAKEVNNLVPPILDSINQNLDKSLEGIPVIFITALYDGSDERTGFHFSGDALPGQILITLRGQAWNGPSSKGGDILQRAITHELIHLWQNELRPKDNNVPDWIHEGGAEAMTAEILAETGFWTPQRSARFYGDAYQECASLMKGKIFSDLEGQEAFKASYACGHVLSVLATTQGAGAQKGQKGLAVTHFWRDFLQQSQNDGYSFQSWLQLIRDRSQKEEPAKSLEVFVRTPWLSPGTEITRIRNLSKGLAQ